MPKYKITYIDCNLFLFDDEEYEGVDEIDAKEQILEEISDNLGNYVDIELEEVDEDDENEENF